MKILIGKVAAIHEKTIIVEVTRQRIHPLYKKIMKMTKRYKVHHEGGNLKLGEVVKIIPTSPKSKEKHYRLLK